jgi:hypothetical protein
MGINFAFINQMGIKVKAGAGYERRVVGFQKSHESSAWGLRNEYKL